MRGLEYAGEQRGGGAGGQRSETALLPAECCQLFQIALLASNRRGDSADAIEAEALQRVDGVIDRPTANVFVTYDSTLADLIPARLKLGFDQTHERCPFRQVRK